MRAILIQFAGTALAGAVIALSVLLLSGCSGFEGDGYSNGRGYADMKLCVRKDALGHEVWVSVRPGQPCPKGNYK